MHALALLLSDGRLPTGGHAHSGGIEAAAEAGRVHDVATLAGYLTGRLATAGRVAAGLAAAACMIEADLARLDREASARIASPALRDASRAQGRHLLHAASVIVVAIPSSRPDLHHAVAMGAVARSCGLEPIDAARWAAYESVAGPATAAIRLLGLDPFATWRAVSSLALAIEDVAASALAGGLPSCAAPLLDIGAEHHRLQEVRLFAS